MIRRFTGWHMLAVTCAMFGTIIAVNIVMARFAAATFGGTVVDNSYVASQRFNGWLRAAREQRALGWRLAVTRAEDGRLSLEVRDRAGALAADAVSAVALHPLGRAPERTLRFAPVGRGSYRADAPLPAGRWLLRVEVRHGDRVARFAEEVAS